MTRPILLAGLLLAGAAVAQEKTLPVTAFEGPIATPPLRGPADVEAATAAYVAQLPPEATARSNAYFEGGYWLLLWDALATVAVSWLLLRAGLSTRMRDLGERITRIKFLQTSIYAAQYFVLATVLQLPLAAYEGFFREHQYGLSNQGFGQWLGDQGKFLVVNLIFGALVVSAIYAVMRKLPRTWAAWGSVVTIAVLALFATVVPVFVSPMFNTFKPLPESHLKSRILSLARANGIPADEVWQFDASKQTRRMSANVSGMFGTTRISLNDNLLNRGSPEEIESVLGHEMGHYVLNHSYKFLFMIGAVILICFYLMKIGMEIAQRRWGAGLGLRDTTDIAGFPIAIGLITILFLLLTPVTNTIIRVQEAEADMFGLNASRQPDGFARAALHLSEYRKMHPGAMEELVFFDHPSGWNRIHRSMTWKAEHLKDADLASQRYESAN